MLLDLMVQLNKKINKIKMIKFFKFNILDFIKLKIKQIKLMRDKIKKITDSIQYYTVFYGAYRKIRQEKI